jgi:hypothetical protein
MGCSDRPLSCAGKDALIKSVTRWYQRTSYVIIYLQLPVSTCDQMRRAIVDFCWGVEDSKKKLTYDPAIGFLYRRLWEGSVFVILSNQKKWWF